MLGFRQFLEARRNPDQNPKIGIVQALEPYKNDPDVFISFRSINKIGINPLSRYNTPNGIFAYPVKQMWDALKNDKIPFAGDSPFVYVFRVKPQKGFVADLKDYGSADFDKDMKKIEKFWKTEWSKDRGKVIRFFNRVEKNDKGVAKIMQDIRAIKDDKARGKAFDIAFDDPKNLKKIIKALIDKATKEAEPFVSPVNSFWNVTRTISQLLSRGLFDSSKWNTLLRKLGYIGFADRSGKGIIHKSEPTQAMFLSKTPIKVIGAFDNKRYKESINVTDITTLLKELKSNSDFLEFFRSRMPNTVGASTTESGTSRGVFYFIDMKKTLSGMNQKQIMKVLKFVHPIINVTFVGNITKLKNSMNKMEKYGLQVPRKGVFDEMIVPSLMIRFKAGGLPNPPAGLKFALEKDTDMKIKSIRVSSFLTDMSGLTKRVLINEFGLSGDEEIVKTVEKMLEKI
jgi:hypothetical protein